MDLKKTQHSKLRHSGLSPFFTEVITSEGSNSLKPHKEIFDYALLRAKASTSESIMIGDTEDVIFRAPSMPVWIRYLSII